MECPLDIDGFVTFVDLCFAVLGLINGGGWAFTDTLNVSSSSGSITGTFKGDEWVVAVCVFKGVSFDVRNDFSSGYIAGRLVVEDILFVDMIYSGVVVTEVCFVRGKNDLPLPVVLLWRDSK